MKRIYAYILLLVLLGGTSIWAYNRGGRRPNVKDKWGRVTATDSEGTLETEAWIDVDVDYPGESWLNDQIPRRYGIDYESSAKVSASFGWNRSGYYSCTPAANTPYPRYLGNPWNRWVNKTLKDRRFVRHSGSSADSLRNMDRDDIKRELNTSSSVASITQDAQSGSGSGSSSGTPAYRSTADAYIDIDND